MERLSSVVRRRLTRWREETGEPAKPEREFSATHDVNDCSPTTSAQAPDDSGAGPIAFDEEWYLYSNPDVARRLRELPDRSALQHYVDYGRREGRAPLPPPGWDRIVLERAKDTADGYNTVDPSLSELAVRHRDEFYLTPADLTVTDATLRRIAIIGSCMTEAWGFHRQRKSTCAVDFITVNNMSNLPPEPPEAVRSYDLQVIQLPLRGVLPDHLLWRLPYGDVPAHQRAFESCCRRLDAQLDRWMEWNRQYGLLTFVSNFFLPQQNPMGRLFPRFDIRNTEYFVEKLNEHLEHSVRSYRNAFVLDIDRISASLGRRYIQDDSVLLTSHGSVMCVPGIVANRIEPLAPMQEHYDVRWSPQFQRALWSEITTMFRTIHQKDSVKLVAVDLDDTLWHGVSGDTDEIGQEMIAGWPLGLAEALIYLKKRGVLLAIISKNEQTRIREIWPRIYGERLRLEDFAAVKINWCPKIDNMREVLDVVNILPRSVVFLDDNPVERAAMSKAFTDMRVLGRHPYYLRRVLLWSSETQVTVLTEESARRTEMIQAQFEREIQRESLSHDQFLQEASPRVTLFSVTSTDHPRFPRVLELINKTNQFNTTAKRWKTEECEEFLRHGKFHAFEVEDSYTNYGLVGVVVVRDEAIVQWVMSCRVMGYQIEEAVMAKLVEVIRGVRAREIVGMLVKTGLNYPCRDLFARCGFQDRGDRWTLEAMSVVMTPKHVTVAFDSADAASAI